jgi:hypothetical protein
MTSWANKDKQRKDEKKKRKNAFFIVIRWILMVPKTK